MVEGSKSEIQEKLIDFLNQDIERIQRGILYSYSKLGTITIILGSLFWTLLSMISDNPTSNYDLVIIIYFGILFSYILSNIHEIILGLKFGMLKIKLMFIKDDEYKNKIEDEIPDIPLRTNFYFLVIVIILILISNYYIGLNIIEFKLIVILTVIFLIINFGFPWYLSLYDLGIVNDLALNLRKDLIYRILKEENEILQNYKHIHGEVERNESFAKINKILENNDINVIEEIKHIVRNIWNNYRKKWHSK